MLFFLCFLSHLDSWSVLWQSFCCLVFHFANLQDKIGYGYMQAMMHNVFGSLPVIWMNQS